MQKLQRFLTLVVLFSLTFSTIAAGPVIWSGDRSKVLTSKGFALSDKGKLDYDGEINYIRNGHAEVNANGYSTFADTAAATPTDGTGGTATGVTFARTTANNIDGTASFELSKDASNRQGDGVSYDFTIPSADENKLLKIEFPWKNLDSNYAAGDVGVWIYDVTNSTLITPSQTTLSSKTTDGGPIFSATWVSTTSTSYRIIWYIASTNASAWDLVFDRVVVGPGTTVSGTPIGPWTSVTGTVSGGLSATVTTREWQNGPSAKYEYTVVANASPGTFSNIDLSLPSGRTIDTALINTTSSQKTLGSGTYKTAASGSYYDLTAVYQSSTSLRLKLRIRNSSDYIIDGGSTNDISNSSPQTIASGDKIVFTTDWLPISEFSGSYNIGNNQPEFASSTNGTWDAAASATDTTHSLSGSPISGALTADRDKVVRFAREIQPTDRFALLLDENGTGEFVPFGARVAATFLPSANFGWRVIPSSSNKTDVTVRFFQYAYPGTTYNSTTGAVAWNTAIGTSGKWLLEKYSAGQPVGFGIANSTTPGLVNNQANGSFTATFTQSGGYSQAVTVNYRLTNNTVTMTIPAFKGTCTAASAISATGAVPSALRPATRRDFPAFVIDNSTEQSTIGNMSLNNTGTLQLSKTWPSSSFTNSGACGLQDTGASASFTYILD